MAIRSLCRGLLWLTASTSISAAQPPVAGMGGTITDASAAAIAGAAIVITEEGTETTRVAVAGVGGRYRFHHLEPGTYRVEASHAGFRTGVRHVALRLGDNAVVDFELQAGGPDERIEVEGVAPAVNHTDITVAGTVSRAQIADLPLNGRSFLELAQLQPGVGVVSVTNPGALGNNYQRVLVAGAYYSQTHVSVDGSTIGDRFAGGTMQGFSQESVQEFQVSTFNLDLSTGVAGSGAINIVTRRGSNDFSGSAFHYYRDHHLAAYPGFRRQPRVPSFARRQSGGSGGGAFVRDRLFWFANYERNNQDAAFAVTNNHPIFSKFDGIYPNPLTSDQINLRLDGRAGERHQASLRVSVERNETTAPAVAVGLPSNWQSIANRAFQVQGGLISVWSAHAVNDLRVSYTHLDGDLNPMAPAECTDAVACIGVGGPNILVFDAHSSGSATRSTRRSHAVSARCTP